ncbi:MAG TPA: PHB depolymerase family esterase [Casimicrobiaceae bacterium]|nr:PHB depolymerase family esterase [Casimicrobiaceae bacterium]
MNIDLNRTMQETMRLMQAGDLHAATRAIQQGLAGAAPGQPASARARSGPPGACVEGEYRVIPDNDGRKFAPGTSDPRNVESDPIHSVPSEPQDLPAPERRASEPYEAPASEPHDGPILDGDDQRQGEFRDHRFTCEAGSMHYKLFIPAGVRARAPLIVMLHGCTQSPDDFARGTRMNALAQEHGYVVAYPAQSKGKNPSKCWNWFRSDDQQRGQGEPAMLAALTRHLVEAHRLDERRVYVAGLSAGGAMAAVLANTYPDVYAAIGVHSGLPFGVARDLPSAFAAMKQGAMPVATAATTRTDSVPAIVFHGDRDTTVDPCNGVAVVEQCMGTAAAEDAAFVGTRATVERGSVPGGRSYTRTIYSNAEGTVVAEQWLVHGAGHAWFGGDVSGSYTDPAGPDASEQMLRFFSACARAAIN